MCGKISFISDIYQMATLVVYKNTSNLGPCEQLQAL